ncbi:MAG: nucleotidyltransferase domain-containing protein [Armatimonadota bacterium]
MEQSEIIERNMRVARQFADWMRERFGDVVLEARVYGSTARGEADEDADVDVFFLLSRRLTFEEQLEAAGKAFDLDMQHGTWTGWMTETKERWESPVVHGSGWARAVRREGVPV